MRTGRKKGKKWGGLIFWLRQRGVRRGWLQRPEEHLNHKKMIVFSVDVEELLITEVGGLGALTGWECGPSDGRA